MRRAECVVASRGRALAYAVLRAHKSSLFFGDFHPQPWDMSGCFFTTAGRKKGVKHRFSAHLTKKRCAGEIFTGDMYKTVEKLCKNLFDRPTLIIIWTHRSDTILEIERELCKRIGRGAPVPRLPLRLGCKRSAPTRPLSLAPPRQPTRPPHCRRAPPLLSTNAALPRGLSPRGGATARHAAHRPTLSPPRKATDGALPFSPFFAPILYIRAREDTFRPLGGRGPVRPAEEKRKGGGKRTGWWTFSPHCGKDGGKQIVDKWKIGAPFPPPRDERMRSGERCPNSGSLNRKSAARSTPLPHTRWRKQTLKRENRSLCPRKSPHTGTETQHSTAKTQCLSTKKGRSEPETSERKAKNSCAPRTITTRGASRRARIFSRTKPFARGNEEK